MPAPRVGRAIASEHPPEAPLDWLACTQRALGSHTNGATQSFTLPHGCRHAPPAQTYGAQSCVMPLESVTVCPSGAQRPPLGTHAPWTQVKPVKQSASAAHAVLHALVPAHAKLAGHC
jgi:hypothetical protein